MRKWCAISHLGHYRSPINYSEDNLEAAAALGHIRPCAALRILRLLIGVAEKQRLSALYRSHG